MVSGHTALVLQLDATKVVEFPLPSLIGPCPLLTVNVAGLVRVWRGQAVVVGRCPPAGGRRPPSRGGARPRGVLVADAWVALRLSRHDAILVVALLGDASPFAAAESWRRGKGVGYAAAWGGGAREQRLESGTVGSGLLAEGVGAFVGALYLYPRSLRSALLWEERGRVMGGRQRARTTP